MIEYLDGDAKAEFVRRSTETADEDLQSRGRKAVKAFHIRRDGRILFQEHIQYSDRRYVPLDALTLVNLYGDASEPIEATGPFTALPDGKHVLCFLKQDPAIVDMESGECEILLEQVPNRPTVARFRPTVSRLAKIACHGKQFCFSADVDGGKESIFTANLDGSDLKQLTAGAYCSHPVYSTDGATIAFRHEIGGETQVWLMSADGENQRPLTHEVTADPIPLCFNADGSKLFCRAWGNGTQELWVVPLDGTQPTAAFRGMEIQLGDGLSADGKLFTFGGTRKTPAGVWEYGLWSTDWNGKSTLLSTHTAIPLSPCFSADGHHIAYVDSRHVCIVDTDGKNARSLCEIRQQTVADPVNLTWSVPTLPKR